MKINVHAGHNYHVPGAGGQFSETTQNRVIRDKVISLLRAEGHTVYDCTDDNAVTANSNLAAIVAKCNAHSVDLDVSIHFNCYDGKAHGTEVWVHTNSTIRPIAQRIANNIASLGFTNRGVKETTALYVIRKTIAPALLIECCFCDSSTDSKLYDPERMARAIAGGILNKNLMQTSEKNTAFKVRVVANDLNVRKGAGTNYDIVEVVHKGDVYTIVDTTTNWYKLKSGIGWIAAKHVERI